MDMAAGNLIYTMLIPNFEATQKEKRNDLGIAWEMEVPPVSDRAPSVGRCMHKKGDGNIEGKRTNNFQFRRDPMPSQITY
ncbi:hypothetical protein PM082_007038 [Marasmius tenuissimus]|nr:hypothetical protein PM082_007038 [Marasmius tenuissimus]